MFKSTRCRCYVGFCSIGESRGMFVIEFSSCIILIIHLCNLCRHLLIPMILFDSPHPARGDPELTGLAGGPSLCSRELKCVGIRRVVRWVLLCSLELKCIARRAPVAATVVGKSCGVRRDCQSLAGWHVPFASNAIKDSATKQKKRTQ